MHGLLLFATLLALFGAGELAIKLFSLSRIGVASFLCGSEPSNVDALVVDTDASAPWSKVILGAFRENHTFESASIVMKRATIEIVLLLRGFAKIATAIIQCVPVPMVHKLARLPIQNYIVHADIRIASSLKRFSLFVPRGIPLPFRKPIKVGRIHDRGLTLRKWNVAWLACLLLFGLSVQAQAVPAFPNAVGGGAASVGGRGGVPWEVTNLNDSGTGSLRACLQATSERTCVFRVGGVIIPKSRLAVNNPYVTVACQTAPGGGIVIGGPGNLGEVFQVTTHDVIISYCTWDGNNGTTPGPSDGSVGMEGGNGNAHDVMFANNTSYRWGNKGNFTISNDSGNASKISFYRGFIFTPNAGHPVVSEPDTTTGSALASTNIDFIQNLIAFYDHRCILFNIGSTSMVNNVCYDGIQESSSFNTNFWNGLLARFEGNLYIDGPDSHNKVRNIIGQFPETGNDASDCYGSGPPPGKCDTAHRTPQLYLKDNVGHPNDQTGATPIPVTHMVNDAGQISLTYQGWEGGQDPKPGIVIAPMPSNWFVSSDPTPKEAFPIVALADPLSFDTNVAPFVGNYQGLACDGTWFPRRNSLDAQAMAKYLARGSMPMFTVGQATPVIAPGTACAEDSKNSLPLAFEAKWNIPAGTPWNTPEPDGYTLGEHYIWSIPLGPVPPTVTCAPSSITPGANSSCSANQQIATWKSSAGSITPSGVLTAPMTPSMVTVTGTNPNGSGQAPVTVAAAGTWTGWLGADALPGAAVGAQVTVAATAGPLRQSPCTVAGGAPGAAVAGAPSMIGLKVTILAGPPAPSPVCSGGVAFWNVTTSTTPPPTPPTITCTPSSVQTGGTATCTANQTITTWSATAGTITAAGLFTAPATAQTVTVKGTNANGSGTAPITVTATPPTTVYPPVSFTIGAAPGPITTVKCTANQTTGAYACVQQ